uniref:Tyrosine-sulfated glycopeptide receptor 1 n=1 Tax=Aegilops tauschii TaxID=37682 RepID=M8BUZ4_AEGTA
MHIPSLGLALVLLISLASPASSCTQHEKNSLLQFLAELSQDGGLAASWRNNTDCCKWEGITCRKDMTVTEILLPSKGLQGKISQSLGILTGLQYLDLSHNSLSGGLPLELVPSSSIIFLDVSFNQLNGTLHELSSSTPARPLQVLNISSNLFAGQFPSTTWKAMENLIALNASNNSFTGHIPTHFCSSSPSLAVLNLCLNKFSGNIPKQLGDCPKLRELRAGYNNISGEVPDELFNATLLEYLSFPKKYLNGAINDAHLPNLRNLVTLDLGGNIFSGKIPDSIGQLKKLEEFHMDNNNMSGELPYALSNCTNLRIIDLKTNNFSGQLNKVNFSSLPNLKILDLLYNSFSGTIPESIYSCSNLTALRLSSNHLDGQLSPRIGDLKNITDALRILKSCRNLITLLIGRNFMGEHMSEDDILDGFPNLQALAIDRCSLLGKIPRWLSKITNLEMLFLYGNQLTGPIPDWISSLNFLFHLDIRNNSLTGEIPTALMDMHMLKSETTEAHFDRIVFRLPVYEGQIPISVCNLTNLQVLDFSSNNLTGAIPAALNSLQFLSAFNISYNDLEGSIPSGGQFNTFQTFSFDGNNKLSGAMLVHKCGSAKARPANIVSTKQTDSKATFAIAFGAFFGVGVLYDQIVLSRYFG